MKDFNQSSKEKEELLLEGEDTSKNNKEQNTAPASISKKSRKHFKYRSTSCLNCEQPLDLSDRYCPYCSQLNSTKQLRISDFFSEFVNSIVSFDSRLRYTLKDLLFKPGTITKNYVEGKRLKYANPFRFFLSVSIIYFLANTFISNNITNEKNDFNQQINKAIPFLNINIEDNKGEMLDSLLVSELENIDEGSPLSSSQINDSITKFTSLIKKQSLKKDTTKTVAIKEYKTEQELDTLSWEESSIERVGTYINFYKDTKISNPSQALDSLGHHNTRYNRWLYNKNLAFDKIKADPYGFISYTLNKIPFFLFLFTPFFALFFWLLYFNKKISYMEHIVFVFHIFSFVFLCMIIALIIDTIIGIDLIYTLLFVLIGPFYFYKALRNFYKQNRVFTFIKFSLLSFVFVTGSMLIYVFFFLITSATY